MKLFLLLMVVLSSLFLAVPPTAQAVVPQMDCVNHPNGGGTDPNGNAYIACIDDNVQSPGDAAQLLSSKVYCQSKSVLASNVGLLVGLAVALLGLYRMVNGNLSAGFILLISGALVTALPSLVESTLTGVGSFVSSSGLGGQTFKPPQSCANSK